MTRKYVLPLLAIVGVLIAIGAVVLSNRPPRAVASAVQVPSAPFATYVAGAGIVEASTENIAVGTPVSGIVTAIYSKWGARVAAGDPLFKIDDRDLQAQRLPANAKVQEAKATLAKARNLLRVIESLRSKDQSAIRALDVENLSFDVAIDEAALASAQAQIQQIKIETERRTVRAPISGRILQIKMRLGEFAPSGVLNTPLMLLGDDVRLHVRVNIDENDAWRVRSGAAAVGFVRGNPTLKTALQFERIEPVVIPKSSLTGASTERTDMRVLQAIFSFDPAALPIYIGQQLEVFIAAPPIGSTNVSPQPKT